MFGIIIIKILLVGLSVCSLGILPLVALLNQWIWNTIIVGHVLACAIPISSFWIVLGLTSIGGCGLGGLIYKVFK